VEIYYPAINRCVARFLIPQSGEYKVIADSVFGSAQSIGYVEVQRGKIHIAENNLKSIKTSIEEVISLLIFPNLI
jgi:hypothetical protein